MTFSMLRALNYLLFVLWLGLWPAAAADRVALVIGNSAYKFATALPNPVNDATDFSEKLKTLGFEVFGGNDLDLVGMQGAVRQFAENSSGAKVVLFFYAGHGMEVNGKNYLIPVDAKLESPTALNFEVFDANIILNFMVEEKRIAVALLDACRDNPLARSFKKKSRSAVGNGLAEVKVDQVGGGGLLYGLATGPGDTAADGEGRNSPFTKALLKHIGAPGVEFEQMMKSVKRDVDTDTKGDQRPYLTSSLVDDLYLVPASAVKPEKPIETAPTPEPKRNASADWELVKNSKSAAVLNAFLKKHGDDALYRGLAEERITELSEKQIALVPPDPVTPALAPSESNQPAEETSPNAIEIKVENGYFKKRGKGWVETDLQGVTKFHFVETAATDSRITVYDIGRDAILVFDLNQKLVLFGMGKETPQTLYQIESVSSPGIQDKDIAIPVEPPPQTISASTQMEEVSPKRRIVTVGKWPEGMAVDANGALWVAESGARQIVKVDLSTGEVVAKVSAGRLPVSMASTPNGDVYAATFTDGKLWRQPASGKGKSVWQLPSRAHVFIDIAANDSAVFAIHYSDTDQRMTSLTRFDPKTGKTTTSEPFVGEGRALRMADGAAWVLMGNGTLAKHDTQSFDYLGGADTNYFLWSLTANTQAVYSAGKTTQTPEGKSIIARQDAKDPLTRIEKLIEGNELILTMAATDTHVAALGENGNIWIFDAIDLKPLKHFNSGAQPRSALFHKGQLFVTTHQGNGGLVLIFDGLTD